MCSPPQVEYEAGTVEEFFGVISSLEVARLRQTLTIDRAPGGSGGPLGGGWQHGVYEVLRSPSLLGDRGVMEALTARCGVLGPGGATIFISIALSHPGPVRSLVVGLEWGQVALPSSLHVEGLLLLLVHPEQKVRSWAIETVGTAAASQGVNPNLQVTAAAPTAPVFLFPLLSPRAALDPWRRHLPVITRPTSY